MTSDGVTQLQEAVFEVALETVMAAEDGDDFRARMIDMGNALAMDLVGCGAVSSAGYHVVSNVEDFDGLAAGVRDGLSRYGNVTYSCLWSQFEVLSVDPRIEVNPIYKAYHQPKPERDYSLVLVASNIGSASILEWMSLHVAADKGFSDYAELVVVSPVVHRGIAGEMAHNSRLSKAVWSRHRIDVESSGDGNTVPGVGGPPALRYGFSDVAVPISFMPDDVASDLSVRRARTRASRLASQCK